MAKGNQENALKTPQSIRRKIPNMSKNELTAELEEHRAYEEKYDFAMYELQELKKEVSELKESLYDLRSSKETNNKTQTNLEERLIKDDRPISLTSNYSKIMEKLVHQRLYLFLGNNNVHHDKKFGFLNKLSTTHVLTKITEKIRQALDNKKVRLWYIH